MEDGDYDGGMKELNLIVFNYNKKYNGTCTTKQSSRHGLGLIIIKRNNLIEMCFSVFHNNHINEALIPIKPKWMLHIVSIRSSYHTNLNPYLLILLPKMVNNINVKY